ncbi:DUF624 domain-containing protein [Gracilibacillus sp. YIM 98692]|uniref:DUF624 domain-containing protein n=1 Tax=Gracilibacillus sp. YIM 98692 TaxID=2663532 RepID=UPI001F09A724|nr:DUF624 domain-containing protein [Gracilibacillus sp. YIM 98692]
MNQLESTLFRVLHVFASYLAIQLLWFFFSLGVVTIIPATLAMYAVILDWSRNGVDIIGVWRNFFQSFQFYFKNTLLIALNVVFAITLFVMYVSETPFFFEGSHLFLQIGWWFMVSVFLLTLISMVPLAVSSHLKGLKLWKNAWIASLTLLPQVLLIGSIGGIFALISVYIPMAFVAAISVFAFLHVSIWQQGMKKMPEDFLDECLFKYRYR